MRPTGNDARGQVTPNGHSRRFVVTVTAFGMLLGACMIRDGLQAQQGPPQPPDAAAAALAAGPGGSAEGVSPAPLLPSPPLRIRIPAIRVDAPLMSVGLDGDGWIEPPPAEETNLAGWYRGAPSPGAGGTAVVVGHVDNAVGPTVFYSLGALRKGDTVQVPREDGRTAVFTVYAVDVFAKDDFPGERVYGDTGHPELRVITCGGGYTPETGYQGNVVVFARLTKTH